MSASANANADATFSTWSSGADAESRACAFHPFHDPLNQRFHLPGAVLRLQVPHVVSENAAIAFARKFTSLVAPVVVDPLEYSVEVCMDLLAEIPICTSDAGEELKSASEMNLGAASAAPLAKVGRTEFPRDMKTHGSPQQTARARRDMVQGNWFRNGFRKCFRNPRPFGPWQAAGGAPRWLFVEGAANFCREVLVCLLKKKT